MPKYITITERHAQSGNLPDALVRLTYEITVLRPGVERWFLVAKQICEIYA